ncbi:MAG: hypothetical protein HXS40_01080 [Theionarchaea archaeon]|nr:hypothetical protein [Theionarchaea archaeon]
MLITWNSGGKEDRTVCLSKYWVSAVALSTYQKAAAKLFARSGQRTQ